MGLPPEVDAVGGQPEGPELGDTVGNRVGAFLDWGVAQEGAGRSARQVKEGAVVRGHGAARSRPGGPGGVGSRGRTRRAPGVQPGTGGGVALGHRSFDTGASTSLLPAQEWERVKGEQELHPAGMRVNCTNGLPIKVLSIAEVGI